MIGKIIYKIKRKYYTYLLDGVIRHKKRFIRDIEKRLYKDILGYKIKNREITKKERKFFEALTNESLRKAATKLFNENKKMIKEEIKELDKKWK